MKRIVELSFILAITACGSASLPAPPASASEKNNSMIIDATRQIKSGDIVLRCGRDVTSYRIREMSVRDKTYSHAGIACETPDGIFIYHLTPPELDEPKADTVIRFEPLDKFADPAKNFEFGIARFGLSGQQIRKLMNHLEFLKSRHVSFDFLFDLKSHDRMYCSEMIDESLRFATGDSVSLQSRPLQDEKLVKKVSAYLRVDANIVRSRLYIPIESIYLNPNCKTIARYQFNN